MIRLKNALLIILIGIPLVACTHTYYVKLYDPLTYEESRFAPRDVQEGKPTGAEKIRVVIKRSTDSRSDKTRLGDLVQYGVARTILFDKDIVLSDLFTNNLITLLSKIGFKNPSILDSIMKIEP